MSETWVTETVHGEVVKGGEIQSLINGKEVTFDIKQLRDKIPPHCLHGSLPRSLAYVFRDLAMFAALLMAVIWLEPKLDTLTSRCLRYLVYPFLAGLPLTGLWVIGHECGHGGFSTYSAANNTVGFLLHSALLTPYFAWRSSHGRHHQYANNMSTDLNYVPFTRDEYEDSAHGTASRDHMTEDAPAMVVVRIIIQQVIGWPWYLLTHITAGPESSPRKSKGWWDNSHFLPSSSLFRESEGVNILASDLGIACMCGLLYVAGTSFGFQSLLWGYVLPWMWVNHWIVMVTYLHHTSPDLPKFKAESWTYLRGALATVDRDPGFVLRHMLHHIIDLHVVHHLFPRIPHYHYHEATEAIKPLLGNLYHSDKQNYWRALWEAFTQCQWVEPIPAKTRQARPDHSTKDAEGVYRTEKDMSDEDGVLWYRGGRMPQPVTVMRGS
ncbi:Uu.00g118970.m01.CDS01 [Anthostomella pinea]|uniref:Uu.00g118970.m01.CDS01 n=1 Tax=Anthostomella pinea TaxID=933095 RepID=A0AAI8VGJ9_9PEZI|nr:Uu.00g118970.m01.CDS01 [Anthostomella pinea]